MGTEIGDPDDTKPEGPSYGDSRVSQAEPDPSVEGIGRQTSSQSILLSWRDIVAIVGTVGTIFFGGLSVYLYEAAKIKPLLTFSVHPLKTELQRPDFDKELGFIYGGTPIESESITSVQVSIWNAGTRSIRDTDVLDPIRLVMPEGSAILSVRIKKASRSTCDFESLDDLADYKAGICRLKWRILEPRDGAVLQIIYAGGAQHDPKLEGTVEGQSQGTAVQEYALNRDTKTISSTSISMTWFGPALILVLAGIALFVIGRRIEQNTESARQLSDEQKTSRKRLAELRKNAARGTPRIVLLFYGVAATTLLVALALLYWSQASPGPPFGW